MESTAVSAVFDTISWMWASRYPGFLSILSARAMMFRFMSGERLQELLLSLTSLQNSSISSIAPSFRTEAELHAMITCLAPRTSAFPSGPASGATRAHSAIAAVYASAWAGSFSPNWRQK